MALRTIIAPLAAALFASAVAWTPAGAAIFGGGGGSSSGGSQSAAPSGGGSSGGGAFHSGGGSGARSAPANRSRNYSRGSHPRNNYRRGGYPRHDYRGHYGSGGAFIFPWSTFGAPYPSYYEDDGTIVCRYRRVRYHGRWVRRRYCWREYW